MLEVPDRESVEALVGRVERSLDREDAAAELGQSPEAAVRRGHAAHLHGCLGRCYLGEVGAEMFEVGGVLGWVDEALPPDARGLRRRFPAASQGARWPGSTSRG